MLREGLRAILERCEQFEVVGEASDGRAAVKLARAVKPDVVVMDVVMAGMNGIEATHQILSENSKTKVVALSIYSYARYVVNILEAGASGYVLKVAAHDCLLEAVQSVVAGRSYLSPEITGTLVDRYRSGRERTAGVSCGVILGSREREVLQLVAEGKTSVEIALLLYIAPKTVETHRHNIMRKLDIHSVAELTKYAIREGLTAVEP
jgi:DNA-binding NarL/FixJ family response regulator